MTATRFYARPVRQVDTDRWTVETNITGLFVEAATEAECREVVTEFAPQLIRENHGVAAGALKRKETGDGSNLVWSLPASA